MKQISTIIFSTLITLALTANVPVKQVRPLAHPEQRSSLGQGLQCYERYNQGGDSVKLIDYAPNLGQYNFNNRASSCCFNGVWILYDDYNYNINNFQAPVFYGWGENRCTNFDASFDKRASSVRLVGPPDSYKYDSLNFYDGDYFMGAEQYLYTDAPQLNYDNLGRSLIVTGCSPWTIYEYNNYLGRCFCVFPADRNNCYPGFYPTSSTLGGLSQQVSSARRGCFCNRKMYPTESLDKNGKITQEGYFIPKK